MASIRSNQIEDFTAVLSLPATSAAGVTGWRGPTESDAAVGGTLVVSFGDHGSNATTGTGTPFGT